LGWGSSRRAVTKEHQSTIDAFGRHHPENKPMTEGQEFFFAVFLSMAIGSYLFA